MTTHSRISITKAIDGLSITDTIEFLKRLKEQHGDKAVIDITQEADLDATVGIIVEDTK